MSNIREIMEELETKLREELDKEYVMTVKLHEKVVTTKNFFFRDFKGMKFVVCELDDGSFTYTWFDQPLRILKRIQDDIGVIPVKFRVEKGPDNQAIYKLY